MSFWVQHGYGKGPKIDDLLDSGPVGGVVLSAADEDSGTLRTTAEALRARDAPFLLDPQTYVWSIPDGTARNHSEHNLEFSDLHWSIGADRVQEIVGAVLAANQAVGSDVVVSPTCLQRGFSDVWTPLAIQLARATLSAHDSARVLISVVIDEGALSDWNLIDEWLDVITRLDAQGFYLIVARPTPYPALWDPGRLANLLRLIYRLAALNDYRVLLGYSDVDGLVGLSAGASEFASGWYYSLRHFTEAKWQPSVGGRPARPRVFSGPLLVPVLAAPEGQLAARSALGAEIFPDAELRTRLSSGDSDWSLAEAWAHHLRSLRDLTEEVEAVGPVEARIPYMLERLRRSLELLGQAEDRGLVLETPYRSHVEGLGRALREFAEAEGLPLP